MRFALTCILMLAACEQQQPVTTEVQQPAAPVKPAVTPQTLAATFASWQNAINSHDLAALAGFYAADAKVTMVDGGMEFNGGTAASEGFYKPWFTAFPDVKVEAQLTLLKDRNVAALMQAAGTHEGEFMGLPATHKKWQNEGALIVSFNEDGKIQSEQHFSDGGVVMAQLGAMKAPKRASFAPWANKEVVFSAGNAVETDNLTLTSKADVAFNSHDVNAVLGLVSDDYVNSDVTMPADLDKKASDKNLKEVFAAFSDLKREPQASWAAGNYTVTVFQYAGTNTGDWKAAGIKKTGKTAHVQSVAFRQIENGKIKKTYELWNSIALVQQLGLMPPPGAKPKMATK